RARELRDHALHGPTRRELDDREADQHDPEQGRDHEQDPLQEISGHGGSRTSVSFRDQFAFTFAALAASYHQASGAPRLYLGFVSGKENLSQYAMWCEALYHCGTQ